jgi:uncharacterized membrane protein YfcA
VVDDRLQLAGFVVLLALAAWGMLRGGPSDADDDAPPADRRPWAVVVAVATGVGFVTGFFGVGGGFVAVPALVLAMRMPMRRAGPTALVVILVNASVALAAQGGERLDVQLTLVIAAAAAVGAVAGAVLQPRVPSHVLQRAFGVLLVLVACYEAIHVARG